MRFDYLPPLPSDGTTMTFVDLHIRRKSPTRNVYLKGMTFAMSAAKDYKPLTSAEAFIARELAEGADQTMSALANLKAGSSLPVLDHKSGLLCLRLAHDLLSGTELTDYHHKLGEIWKGYEPGERTLPGWVDGQWNCPPLSTPFNECIALAASAGISPKPVVADVVDLIRLLNRRRKEAAAALSICNGQGYIKLGKHKQIVVHPVTRLSATKLRKYQEARNKAGLTCFVPTEMEWCE